MRGQPPAAQLGRFAEHPSLLLEGPFTHNVLIGSHQRKATRLLQPS